MKREELEKHLTSIGWTKDAYGHFKSPDGQYRMKFQATSVRFERKVQLSAGPEWRRVKSNYYSKMSVVNGKINWEQTK